MKNNLTLISFFLLLTILYCNHISYIKTLNKTHFYCDNEQKILSINKFNDDFCDCNDGSDENSN